MRRPSALRWRFHPFDAGGLQTKWLTGYGSIATAVDSVKLGATSYLHETG
jgi:hypothetical protein